MVKLYSSYFHKNFKLTLLCLAYFSYGNLVLSIGQELVNTRDSILKYEFTNPSKAIDFSIKFSELAKDLSPTNFIQQTYGRIGQIFLENGFYNSSLNYFEKAILTYRELDIPKRKFPNLNFPPWIILNIGNVYLHAGRYDLAKIKYLESQSLFQKLSDSDAKVNGLNTVSSNLGLIAELTGDLDSAYEIYNKILENKITDNNYEDIFYSYAQVLAVELKRKGEDALGQLEITDQLYKEIIYDPNLSKNTLIRRNYGYSYLVTAAYFQSQKYFEIAIKYLVKSQKYFTGFQSIQYELSTRLAQCYKGLGEFPKAENLANLNLQKKGLSSKERKYNLDVLEMIYSKENRLNDLIRIKDSIITFQANTNSNALTKSLGELETKIKIINLENDNEIQMKKYNLYFIFLLIGLLLLTLTVLLVKSKYDFQKANSKSLELTNQNIKIQLQNNQRDLLSKTNFILQRNESLRLLKKKISANLTENQIDKKILENEFDKLLKAEKYYSEFEKIFNDVFPNFFTKLNKEFNLSKTEIRLCAYIKMNLSVDDIVMISSISKRTVESQRYRVSKKLNLKDGSKLNSFIHSI